MNDIHDIHGPVQVGIDPLIFKVIGMVLAGMVLVIFLFFFIRRVLKKRRRSSTDQLLLPEPLPPFEQAMKALAQLGVRQFLDLRLFYFELTAVLKKYIGAVYAVNAPEMTSQEFIKILAGLDLEKKITGQVHHLINASDQVKYAGDIPAEEMIEKDLSSASSIIRGVEDYLRLKEENHV